MSNQEIENIINRLKGAGVQPGEQEISEISKRYELLVKEWHVPPVEAIRTVVTGEFKKRGIDTKVWQTGGTAALVLVDQIKSDNEWVSIKGKIVQIWENRSDKIARTGLIGDSTGVIKFTIFQKNKDIIPSEFIEGKSYSMENFVTSVWQGQYSVKGNKTSKIIELQEEIDVSRASEEITGIITAVLQGSGLVKRCPECNRTLLKGACGEHGKVQGRTDMRIKAVMSKFGTNESIDLIVPREATEKVTDMTLNQAQELAMDQMSTEAPGDAIREKLTARYFKVSGSIMSGNAMLVSDMEETTIAQDELKKAITECKGGN